MGLAKRLKRMQIADEIVRRADTVTLLTCDEVARIRERALAGEFDDVFAGEERES